MQGHQLQRNQNEKRNDGKLGKISPISRQIKKSGDKVANWRRVDKSGNPGFRTDMCSFRHSELFRIYRIGSNYSIPLRGFLWWAPLALIAPQKDKPNPKSEQAQKTNPKYEQMAMVT